MIGLVLLGGLVVASWTAVALAVRAHAASGIVTRVGGSVVPTVSAPVGEWVRRWRTGFLGSRVAWSGVAGAAGWLAGGPVAGHRGRPGGDRGVHDRPPTA